jgi:hypothetical protein
VVHAFRYAQAASAAMREGPVPQPPCGEDGACFVAAQRAVQARRGARVPVHWVPGLASHLPPEARAVTKEEAPVTVTHVLDRPIDRRPTALPVGLVNWN